MAVHFDFVVEDEEADFIFGAIGYWISDKQLRMLVPETTPAEKDWLTRHIEYVRNNNSRA